LHENFNFRLSIYVYIMLGTSFQQEIG